MARRAASWGGALSLIYPRNPRRRRAEPVDTTVSFGKTAIWAGTLFVLVVAFASTASALPKNFRNVDIFYIGGMPSADDMDELHDLGIEQIISLHRLPKDVSSRAKKLGLETHSIPWRTRLVRVDEIMEVLEGVPSGTVFVHCQHGADRAGAVAAYWLYSHRDYEPFAALAAVISPSAYHIKGLKMLAREYSLNFDPVDSDLIGRFSGARNGGLEGLKVRGGEWYTRLARNYLEMTMGPPLREPHEKFWGYDARRKK